MAPIDRFPIERKISDTLLGATYECRYSAPLPTTKTPPKTTQRRQRRRASVVVKCSSLQMRARLLKQQQLLSSCDPLSDDHAPDADGALDDPVRERAVVAALIASGGHANVLQCYDHFTTSYLDDSDLNDTDRNDTGRGVVICVVTEFCDGGDLFSHLTARQSNADSATDELGLGEREAVALMLQVARGVAFLQTRLGLAHRDLSLENVLLRGGTCKVADFGLAVPRNQRCQGRAGKSLYMAPEVAADGVSGAAEPANSTGYDPAAADVWSLGVMLFMLLTGSPLVDVATRDDPRFVALVDRGVGAIAGAWGVAASPELVGFLDTMLSEWPAQRPTVSQVVDRLYTLEGVAAEVAERRRSL